MPDKKKTLTITHSVIAGKLGLGRSTVTMVLNRVQNSRIGEETIRRVFRTAERLGYDFTRMRSTQRREFAREPLNARTEIEIYLKDGKLFDSGHATIRNISPQGALLKRLSLTNDVLPITPFTINLKILEGRLKDVRVRGEMIRFESNGYIDIGVRFLGLDKRTQERLIQLVA